MSAPYTFSPQRPSTVSAASGLLLLVLLCPNALALSPGSAPQTAGHALAETPALVESTLLGAGSSVSGPKLVASVVLPEAPAPQLATEPKPKHGTDPAEHIARKSTAVIPSDWHAQPLSARNKAGVGLDGILSIENLVGTLVAAGYEHLENGEPNYGTDRGAFAQRFGAAALRGATQDVFSDMIFAPLLHEDPRYYVKGPRYSPARRAVYAATRPFITRKDDGSATVNGSLLLGYAAAAALTPVYYPASNRNFHDALSVYGGSLGGAALGFGITEFSQDLFRSLHLKHRP